MLYPLPEEILWRKPGQNKSNTFFYIFPYGLCLEMCMENSVVSESKDYEQLQLILWISVKLQTK